MFGKVNLHDEMLKYRSKTASEENILLAVRTILADNERNRQEIRERLASESEAENTLNIDLLETDRIFHIGNIRQLCIDYRLRFLESKMYKSGFPEEAVTKVMQLEKQHQTNLSGFMIAAPSKAFALENYDDPLLFAPIGNGYYYLVHKWGNDMSLWRKWYVMPFKNLLNFVVFCIAISLLLTWMTPDTVLSRKIPMASTIIFLFLFKTVIAVLMYGFFMGGRRFNDMMWNSRFYNN